jgi:alpha-D-xyloside xylohydrolase
MKLTPFLGRALAGVAAFTFWISGHAAITASLLNEPLDISGDFRDFTHSYYLADHLTQFDPAAASGRIFYQRANYATRQAFDNMLAGVKETPPNEFPANEYEANPVLPFSLEFVTPRTVRLRMTSGPQFFKRTDSLMLAGPVTSDTSWKYSRIEGGHRYASAFGSVIIIEKPWHLEFREAEG